MRTVAQLIAVGFMVCGLTGAARTDTRKQTVLIRTSDATLHTDSDTTIGSYYIFSYALPDSLTSDQLDRAILEVFVDVDSRQRDRFVNESPMLEVYALGQPFSGTFDVESLVPGVRALRPVGIGPGRRVVLDVTQILRSHVNGMVANHGLIMGSLTGMREGEFRVASGRFSSGVIAQIHLYRRHEFIPVAETKRGR